MPGKPRPAPTALTTPLQALGPCSSALAGSPVRETPWRWPWGTGVPSPHTPKPQGKTDGAGLPDETLYEPVAAGGRAPLLVPTTQPASSLSRPRADSSLAQTHTRALLGNETRSIFAG